MKKVYVIFIICMLVISFYSCNKDFLNRQPLDEYSESSLWSSANDAEAALNGCYSGYEDGEWILYMDCASDNAFDPYPWEWVAPYGNMILTTPSGGSWWSQYGYGIIQKCNWFLAGVDKTPMDDGLKTRMKAEARFLRAYRYFKMSQYYGGVPLITTNITTAEANNVTRAGKEEVVKFILDELTALEADLPESYSGSDVGRITKGAAWALKARVELYNQKYADCVTSCNNVIGKYSLFPSYTDLFRIQNENNSEIILDVEHVENTVSLWTLGVMFTQVLGGWWSVDPTQSLVDAYEMNNGKTIDDPASGYDPEDPYKNRDPRLDATVIVPGSLVGGSYFDPIGDPNSLDYYAPYLYTGYSIRKYVSEKADFGDMWNTGLNIPVIRYAEVLLTYAEAKIELNQIDVSVYNAINEVRTRAGMPDVDQSVYNTQVKMRELIRRERRIELAMEGLRLFDIQRWQIGNEVMNGPVYGCRLGTVDPGTGKVSFTSERIVCDHRVFDPAKNYLWPIPQSQIDINKNLIQNPNY
ncbi:MAG: RagB/SusD family nutrient uptake outer membrane protein [Bacteroidota bacterium]